MVIPGVAKSVIGLARKYKATWSLVLIASWLTSLISVISVISTSARKPGSVITGLSE